MQQAGSALADLQRKVVACRRCPRLREHCLAVAAEKRRAYREWDYWGLPVPAFGDPAAELLIVGLAPAAHGANRTGRMFTGDRSGDFLYRALHATGFASQPHSRSRDDGLRLTNAYITAAVRCAPPANKPLREEIAACRGYVEKELALLENLKVVVVLGRIAFDLYLSILRGQGRLKRRADFLFAHGREHTTAPDLPLLMSSYHPSQQNTSTGRLTDAMLRSVFERARQRLEWDARRRRAESAG
ncbi:MAG: uracil-DNA glycosylase [Bryobacteraceae bacterium]|nr:uracil-DNA glycosylase [Bryobacteraceae bacterium]